MQSDSLGVRPQKGLKASLSLPKVNKKQFPGVFGAGCVATAHRNSGDISIRRDFIKSELLNFIDVCTKKYEGE